MNKNFLTVILLFKSLSLLASNSVHTFAFNDEPIIHDSMMALNINALREEGIIFRGSNAKLNTRLPEDFSSEDTIRREHITIYGQYEDRREEHKEGKGIWFVDTRKKTHEEFSSPSTKEISLLGTRKRTYEETQHNFSITEKVEREEMEENRKRIANLSL